MSEQKENKIQRVIEGNKDGGTLSVKVKLANEDRP